MGSDLQRFSCPEANERFSPEDMTRLAGNLVDQGRLAGIADYALAVVDGNEPEAELGRSIEYSEFWRAYGNDYDLMEEQYAKYDQTSSFIIVVDMRTLAPAGITRLIRNGPEGLKTINDVADVHNGWGVAMVPAINAHLQAIDGPSEADRQTSLDKIVDTATVAVTPECRREIGPHIISAALMRASILTAMRDERDLISVVADRVLELYDTVFAQPWHRIPGLDRRTYLGAPSYPVFGDTQEYIERLKRTRPDIVDMIRNGSGLFSVADKVSFPADMQEVEV
jgi:hypothetical protein